MTARQTAPPAPPAPAATAMACLGPGGCCRRPSRSVVALPWLAVPRVDAAAFQPAVRRLPRDVEVRENPGDTPLAGRHSRDHPGAGRRQRGRMCFLHGGLFARIRRFYE